MRPPAARLASLSPRALANAAWALLAVFPSIPASAGPAAAHPPIAPAAAPARLLAAVAAADREAFSSMELVQLHQARQRAGGAESLFALLSE